MNDYLNLSKKPENQSAALLHISENFVSIAKEVNMFCLYKMSPGITK